jgi:Holliday junction resolvase RusA-like endonuclease
VIQVQITPDKRLEFTQSTSFFVPGVPMPGGSKTPGVNAAGRTYLRPACKGAKNWMEVARIFARTQYHGQLLEGPVKLEICFIMPRPLKHYIGGKKVNGLRPDAPYFHTQAPDLDKLIRSTQDSFKGIIWVDDGQVVCHGEGMEKIYGERTGAKITISW